MIANGRWWILAGMFFCAAGGRGETVRIVADRDNTLYENATGAVSNGAGSFLFAGQVAPQGGRDLRRAALHFDLSAIPAGAVVTSATLRLNMSRTVVGGRAVRVHRLLASWGEGASAAQGQEGTGASAATGDATWLHRFFNTQPWGAPGGDFRPEASAERTVAFEGAYVFGPSPGMTADVRHWVEEGDENFGWLLIGDESEPNATSAKRFDSRQNGVAANRPALTVEYVVPVAGARGEWIGAR